MSAGFNAPYELLWGHEDGNFYSCMKVPYEGKSAMFLVYPNGFKIPASMIWGNE